MYLNDKLPQGESESKVDPYTLPALIAWLRTKPADERYDYCNFHGCLIAQYADKVVGRSDFDRWYKMTTQGDTGGKFHEIAFGSTLNHGWTVGAALRRADNLQRYGTCYPGLFRRLCTAISGRAP